MKKFVLSLFLLCFSLMAMADWSFGSATFCGDCPSKKMSIGGVIMWYDGSLIHTMNRGGVEYREGTGNICVAFPRNYSGPQLNFTSIGGLIRIQHLR